MRLEAQEKQMAEKTIPWWRKALEFALGGLRSGFGFFPHPARPEPLTVAKISGSDTDHAEEERALNEPSPQVVAAPAKPSTPANPGVPALAAQPAKIAGKGRVVSKREEKPSSGDKAAQVSASGSAVEAAEPEREAEPVVEPATAADMEVMVEALPEPVKEPEPVIVARPVAEQESAAEHVPAPAIAPAATVAAPPLEAASEPMPEPAPEPVAVTVPAAQAVPRRALKPQPSAEEKAAARKAARQKKLDEGSEESPFSVIVGQVYDGPMDLLLDLIRKQDIDIYDIPIAIITSQFLAYVNQLRASDVDVAGDFIYTASLLIHIKSKMLLPHSETGPEQATEDPRRELVERLLEHERFKNAAQMLLEKQMLEAATWSNPGAREFKDDASAEPEIAADTVDLVRIFREILERARNRPVIDVEEDSVTVSQMIQFLARRLTLEDKPVALRRLLSHTHSERALIAMFLALLEMVRLQAILLRQDRQFSEIFIKKHSNFETVMNEGLGNARDDWR
jgi:segregation and condensation protein A